MAVTTVELRHLLQTNFELFDFDYQFDDLTLKEEIERNVIDYYYFSEIGQETPDRFKHVFKQTFLSLIPYYNKLHNTTLLEYNPLLNYSMKEALDKLSNANIDNTSLSKSDLSSSDTQTNATETSQTHNDTTSSTSSGTTSSGTLSEEVESGINKNTDYPQNTNIGDYMSDKQDKDITRNKDDTTSGTQSSEASGTNTGTQSGTTDSSLIGSSTGTDKTDLTANTVSNSNEKFERTIEGITRTTYQDLIRLERENILRIKSMIIQELKPCFMMVY